MSIKRKFYIECDKCSNIFEGNSSQLQTINMAIQNGWKVKSHGTTSLCFICKQPHFKVSYGVEEWDDDWYPNVPILIEEYTWLIEGI
jgi:hypothetical protein